MFKVNPSNLVAISKCTWSSISSQTKKLWKCSKHFLQSFLNILWRSFGDSSWNWGKLYKIKLREKELPLFYVLAFFQIWFYSFLNLKDFIWSNNIVILQISLMMLILLIFHLLLIITHFSRISPIHLIFIQRFIKVLLLPRNSGKFMFNNY